MSNWPLSGGAVRDRPSDQNFRGLAKRGGEVERLLRKIEKEGLPASGKAGGVLKGEYPNPEFAKEPAYKAELENETTARKEADATLKTSIETEKTERETADKAFVKGPASAVEGDIAVYDGTTGKLVKDGGKTVAEVLARENHTGTQLASTISNFDTQVRTSRLDQMATPTSNVSWGNKKIVNLADPTEAFDAANKSYVDLAASAAAAGLTFKAPVAYATTAALTVSKATEKTLEGTVPLTIDGNSAWLEGTRVLLKNQVKEAQNGIYTVTLVEGVGGTGKVGEGEEEVGEGESWVLTRATDADTEAEVQRGMYVPVTKGTTNGGTAWTLSTENPIIIGTTAQTFTPFTATPGGAAGGDLTGTYPNPTIKEQAIVNADVNNSAGIEYKKLSLAASIKGSDLVKETVEAEDLAPKSIVTGKLGALGLGSRFFWGPYSAPVSAGAGANNRMFFAPVVIPHLVTLTGLVYMVGGTSSGNVRVALYNNAGTRVANKTSNVAQGTANNVQQVAFDSTYEAEAGRYFMGIIFSLTAGTFIGATALTTVSVATEASFVTPASFSPPTSAPATSGPPLLSTY